MAKTLTERTLVIAHRGACAYAPENTMEAFALAVEMKADGIETDVHFSKDGHIMILHDEKLDRTSNGQGLVTDYTLEELKHFDLGYKFKKALTGVRIPTVEELYELIKPTDMIINVEIKSADPRMPAALAEITKKYGMQDRLIYSSFNHLQLVRMLEVDPDAFVAPLYGFNMIKPWEYCANIPAKASHPRYDQISLFPEYVEECHKRGIRVHPWTCDDPEAVRALAEAGCDAVITNTPDVARRVLGYAD